MLSSLLRPEFLYGTLSGIISTLIATAFVTFRSWYPRLADSVAKITSSTPKVDEFEKLVKRTYKGFPIQKRRPHFYVRTDYPRKAEEDPTFHFFINPETRIQQFKAFLIPPLDFGHGSWDEPHRPTLRGPYFNREWALYLQRISERAAEASRIRTFQVRRLLLPAKKIEFEAKRIIFFDKQILLLFLLDTQWVFETAQTEGSRFKELKSVPPLTLSARRIIQYACDIAMIHEKNRPGKTIECRYIAKSSIAANEYYDFGLYTIEGIPIVYAPIHQKDLGKRITREQVFIGNTSRQMRGIQGFKEDFDKLWTLSEETCRSQTDRNFNIPEKELLDPQGKYYRLNFFTLELFEQIYCHKIREILKQWMDINLQELEMFAQDPPQ
jgi:hypothetical protein